MKWFIVFCFLLVAAFSHPPVVFSTTYDQQSTISSIQACQRAYKGISPWNTKIADPVYDPRSTTFLATMTGPFGSDPTQYTLPVFTKTDATPLTTITYSHLFSDVRNYGRDLTVTTRGGSMAIPIPTNAQAAAGTDSQIIVIDPTTGDEWGFYHAAKNTDGTWTAANGYHYNIHWTGVPPAGFTSRGAGVPYLAGLIRKCELVQGHIDHAIAFAYQHTAPTFVSPATKSDGKTLGGLPEGARLQLKPDATEEEIHSWCTGDNRINELTCRTIVKALQQYGMILIDTAGHPKLYAESSLSTDWGNLLNDKTPSHIPYAAFRVLKF